MNAIESLEEFYKKQFNFLPNNILNEIGHFNVLNLEPIEAEKASKALPYKRRDFFKIMLVIGDIDFNYADKVVKIKKQALIFSNPQIPYKCEHLEKIKGGYYCIFNQQLFHQYGALNQYEVFLPNAKHVFEINNDQTKAIVKIFKKMFDELESEYIHKYDVLRNLVFELIHFAIKIEPENQLDTQPKNASQRIATLFLELLERQFPIDENHLKINLRTASEFATQLNVHVNHLNKSVKEITFKTTTQIITERILQEAKILLKYSLWNISEIAYSLGFSEATYFNNFFKKHTTINPTTFRKK